MEKLNEILNDLKKGIETHSEDEMLNLAKKIAIALPNDSTLALYGDLGTGKTTFTRGLAQGLNIAEIVTSPSYNIYNVYNSGLLQLVHMDAYRLKTTTALEELLLEEFLISPWCWVIEWPENIENHLPQNTLKFYFKILPNGTHLIKSSPI